MGQTGEGATHSTRAEHLEPEREGSTQERGFWQGSVTERESVCCVALISLLPSTLDLHRSLSAAFACVLSAGLGRPVGPHPSTRARRLDVDLKGPDDCRFRDQRVFLEWMTSMVLDRERFVNDWARELVFKEVKDTRRTGRTSEHISQTTGRRNTTATQHPAP